MATLAGPARCARPHLEGRQQHAERRDDGVRGWLAAHEHGDDGAGGCGQRCEGLEQRPLRAPEVERRPVDALALCRARLVVVRAAHDDHRRVRALREGDGLGDRLRGGLVRREERPLQEEGRAEAAVCLKVLDDNVTRDASLPVDGAGDRGVLAALPRVDDEAPVEPHARADASSRALAHRAGVGAEAASSHGSGVRRQEAFPAHREVGRPHASRAAGNEEGG